MVGCGFGGRLGNNVLHVYRAFWFARIHGLPASDVIFADNTCISRYRIADGIRRNIIPLSKYNEYTFNLKVACDVGSSPNVRKRLSELSFGKTDNVQIDGYTFIYPELPWEKALFARLFDNPSLRMELASKYERVLCGNTVGYTVRRTDTVEHSGYRVLQPEFIVSEFNSIIERYNGMVRIIVSSDDPKFVREILSANRDIAGNVFLLDTDEDTALYVLSMCDTVYSNSRLQCSSAFVNDPGTMPDSTFGQVAQCLNRCYKYATMPFPDSGVPYPMLPGAIERMANGLHMVGCGCTYDYPVVQ